MHTRRKFLLGALAPALFATAARADLRCIPDPKHGGQMCKTSIDFTNAFQETYHARHEPEAIWIACVAVVFAAYGHVVQQARIAEEAYGDFSKVALNPSSAAIDPLSPDLEGRRRRGLHCLGRAFVRTPTLQTRNSTRAF